MIFRKNHKDEIYTYQFPIGTENCYEIRIKVFNNLWRDPSVNVDDLVFICNKRMLDLYTPLIDLTGNQDATIDCYIMKYS